MFGKRIISVLLIAVVMIGSFVLNIPSASAASLYNSSSPVPSFKKIEIIDGGVRFTWNKISNSNCPNGVFYRIYYKNASGSWVRMITTAATKFVDTDVHAGKTFVYTIRCVDPSSGEFASGYSTTGWKATYYDAPVISSFASETEKRDDNVDVEEPTEGSPTEDIEEPTEETPAEDAEDTDEEVLTDDLKSDSDFASTGAEVDLVGSAPIDPYDPYLPERRRDTVKWSGSAPAYRIYRQPLDSPTDLELLCESTSDLSYTYEYTSDGSVYAYKIYALDKYGAIASAGGVTPYYIDGALYSTCNRWIYELLSAKIYDVAGTDFSDMSYDELVEAAHSYGALGTGGYFTDGYKLTRQFTADTLVNLFEYKAHSLGNYYNTADNSTVNFTKSSSSNYYAADTTNKNLNTVGYYGWFDPDSKNKLYPDNDVNADEWDNLMNELSLYRTWHGKTVISFGDSGMNGRGNVVNKNGGSYENSWRDINRKDFTNKRFPRYNQELMEGPVEYVGEKYGMIHRDYSWSGASMGTELEKSGSYYVFTDGAMYKSHIANQIRTAIKENQSADLIILNGGDNDECFPAIPYSSISGTRKVYDWGYSAPDWFSVAAHRDFHYENPQYFHYGDKKVTEDYTNETSFVDGTDKTFSLLKKNYPSVPVIYVRSHEIEIGSLVRQRIYQERVLSIAKSYDYKTVDLFNISDLDGYNKRQVARYCYDGKFSNGTVDTRGIHPNGLGYSKCYLPYIEDVMLTL